MLIAKSDYADDSTLVEFAASEGTSTGQATVVRYVVIGAMKAAKSTTINALTGFDFAPTALQRETAISLIAEHSTRPEHREGVLYSIDSAGKETEIARGAAGFCVLLIVCR